MIELKEIDLFGILVMIPLSILAIVYGILDWQVVLFVWLMECELKVKL